VKVLISQKAEADLARIYAFLFERAAPDAAERFRVHAEHSLTHLSKHPETGPHPGWATRHRALRFWVISRTPYIIYYEYQHDTVSIERVLDGRRDVHRIIELGIEDAPVPESDAPA
jgi:plasmid stabilization system protein ParE